MQISTPHFRSLWLLVSALISTALVHQSAAQSIEKTLFTAGTVTTSPSNQDWAYLAFQIDDPTVLRHRKLAIYSKTGAPGSASTFSRKAVVSVQTDPLILKTLIQRATHLGESEVELEAAIDMLFSGLVPNPSLSLPAKLSAVIQGGLVDPKQYGSLVMLSRTHPAVALSLGLAHAQPIDAGLTTFEVREYDKAAKSDLGVVGRVTVEAGNPVVLPAPSRPIQVPDVSVKGHLNAQLRWGTPLDLRRLSLMHFGYNIYRVPQAYAESTGIDKSPPAPDVLAGLAAQKIEDVTRVNNVPAMSAPVMSEVEAADLEADFETFFLNDSNGLGKEDSVRFADGAGFYYFVTARDLLGRDGLVSQGTLVTMHDRVPPGAPRGVSVENDYRIEGGLPKQQLRVGWKQRPVTPDSNVIGYYVHRWQSPHEVAVTADVLANRISGLIPHEPGEPEGTFLDTGFAPPFDTTVYYTVRAVEETVAGEQNLSPNSAPASGVLRDREAPEGPGGGAFIECCVPLVEPDGGDDFPIVDPDAAEVVLDLMCTRELPAIRWAEFFVGGTTPEQRVGRVHFRSGNDTLRKRLRLRRASNEPPLEIYCRVGLDTGMISGFATQSIDRYPAADRGQRVKFLATGRCTEVLWSDAVEAVGCPGHDPHPEEQGGEGTPGNGVHGIKLKIDLTESTKEWRLYRRIDSGKLALLRQGLADFADVQQVEIVDKDLPSTSATLYYFGQLLDQNGNASQLALLGKAVPLRQAPPKPILAPISISGVPGNPQATVKWFCPPHGIERFEILVHAAPGPVPTILTAELGANHHSPIDQISDGEEGDDDPQNLLYGAYFTPQIGSVFGKGPEFQFSFPMSKTKSYLIQIAAISKNGGKRSVGNVQQLKWQGGASLSGGAPVPGTPNVPWPELLPPEPGDSWAGAMISEQIIAPNFNGVGIRIGEVPSDQVLLMGGVVHVKGEGTLKSAIYPPDVPVESGSERLLPIVLYRYQVPSTVYPNVSGDLIQVTPLMEKIAVAETDDGMGGTALGIHDPFIRVHSPDSVSDIHRIYLLDTQPVMRRASYAYVAVRFAKNGEIASVHPIPPVTIQ